jgi:predicted acyl esterase
VTEPVDLEQDLIVENDVMVPMRDGVRLRTDIFRPAQRGR